MSRKCEIGTKGRRRRFVPVDLVQVIFGCWFFCVCCVLLKSVGFELYYSPKRKKDSLYALRATFAELPSSVNITNGREKLLTMLSLEVEISVTLTGLLLVVFLLSFSSRVCVPQYERGRLSLRWDG